MDSREYVDELIQRTQFLSFDLISPVLYEVGLEAAIKEWLSIEIEQKYDIKTEFEDDGSVKPLDEDVQIQLFRSVRELLVNAIKHAQAQKIKVTMRREKQSISIAVEDDGIGFEQPDGDNCFKGTTGLGLLSIRETLNQFGGSIETISESGKGTVAVLTAPLKSENSDQ